MSVIPPAELGQHADRATLCTKAQDMLAYWRGKAGTDRLPQRRQMSVEELAAHLPNLVFIDRHSDPVNFRIRLMGSEVVRKSLQDRTGQWFSDVAGMAHGTRFWRRYDWVARYSEPLFADVDYAGADETVRLCQDLILPLADEDGRVSSMMTLVTYVRMNGSPAALVSDQS